MLMREKNEQSRENAQRALDAYRAVGKQDTDDQAAVGDLVCDLLHLAESFGVLPSGMDDFLTRAVGHWEYERDPRHAEEGV